MEAQYVATFNGRKTTHKPRDGWAYSNIGNARTVCGRKGPFTIEHRQSGNGIAVTCRGCGGSK